MNQFMISLVPVVIIIILATAGINFLVHWLRPRWSRRKHILWSSMLPALMLWLFVNIAALIYGGAESVDGFEILIPLVTSLFASVFVGALIGVPTSWLILKLANWKKQDSLDDIFK